MATLGGAEALRLSDRIGSLEAGKDADLVAVGFDRAGTNPVYDPATAVVFSSAACDVLMTMVGGRELWDGTTVATIDEARLSTRSSEMSARITSARDPAR